MGEIRGGVKSGCVHGKTDEVGHKAVEDVVNYYDYHATLLYLFGLDPRPVSFTRANGTDGLIDGQVNSQLLS